MILDEGSYTTVYLIAILINSCLCCFTSFLGSCWKWDNRRSVIFWAEYYSK